MAARLLVQVVAWGVTVTVARLLVPDDYGVMSYGVVFIVLADMLAEAGVGRALIHKATLTREDLAAAFTLNLLLACAMYAALWSTAGVLADFLQTPELATMLPVLGLMVLLGPFRAVAFALLDRDLRMGRQAAVHVFFSLQQSVTVVALALMGYGYWSLVAGAVLGRVFEVVGLFLATRWTPRLTLTPWRHGDLIRFGLNVSFSSLLLFFYNYSIFPIVGMVVGTPTLGLLSFAFQIISLPTQKITISVNQVAYPVFCQLRNDRATLKAWYLRVTVLLGFFGVPVLAGMAIVAPEAFGLLLGAKWLPAVLPFRLLAGVGLMMIYAASLPPLFDGIGRPDLTLRYSAFCAVLFPTASYCGVTWGFQLAGGHGGLVGVCLAWLVLYPLVIVGLVALTRPITGVGVLDLARPQWSVALAAVVMMFAVWLVRSPIPRLDPTLYEAADVRFRLVLRLVLSIVVGAAVYAGVMVLVARRTVLADLVRLYKELRGRGAVEGGA